MRAKSSLLIAVLCLNGCAQDPEDEHPLPHCSVAQAFSGCKNLVGHLYPANDAASQIGALTAHFVAHGTGHGTVGLFMPSGEMMKGEFSLIRGGSSTFGSIYAEVQGTAGSATGSVQSASRTVPNSSQGIMSMYGSSGTSINCEFMHDNFGGHGYGGCKTSTGALYRMQY